MLQKRMQYLGISETHAHFNDISPDISFDSTSYLDIPLKEWEELGTPLIVIVMVESGESINA